MCTRAELTIFLKKLGREGILNGVLKACKLRPCTLLSYYFLSFIELRLCERQIFNIDFNLIFNLIFNFNFIFNF